MSTKPQDILLGVDVPIDAGLQRAAGGPTQAIIDEVRASGLRGRGGAGFPTATKWQLAKDATGEAKFVVCNADEGEPGTFKDRVLLTERADLVFEGMALAGRAIGASQGIVYLRGEYRYLRAHLESVLSARRDRRVLGTAILGIPGFDFDIEIHMGAGAYVCGEETALIESLEGHRGEPRNRPPFPVNTGFFGQPTIVNNVETLALAARIVHRGGAWFAGFGTPASRGYKLFSVSGDCEKPGVYELPMGIKVMELLELVGGLHAKAVQVGGASGRCISRAEFDRSLCFEDLATGGAIMVIGPGRDMLRVAKNFLEFFVEESCGQCTPCRAGNVALLEGIELLIAGRCSMAHLHELKSLGETMRLTAKCGLGQSSPQAFLSIVEQFSDEVLGQQPRA